jgi:mycothiol synthase
MSGTKIQRRGASQPLTEAEARAVLGVAAEAAQADGAPPLSEQFRLSVEAREAGGVLHLLAVDASGEVVGYAQSRPGPADEPPSAELVVAPGARRRGVGSMLLRELPPGVRIWSHADSGAAVAFARARRLVAVRSLHVMGRALTSGAPWPRAVVPEAYAVRTFERDRDEDEWLRINAAAFAGHPEQGSLTRSDLEQRMAQPWFDPEGFILVVERADPDRIVAFHWTKVDPPQGSVGEVYVVGVSPDHQGEGLGRAVTILGLDLLRSRGLRDVILYVDEENVPAVRTYRALGFESLEVHRQYTAGGPDV